MAAIEIVLGADTTKAQPPPAWRWSGGRQWPGPATGSQRRAGSWGSASWGSASWEPGR